MAVTAAMERPSVGLIGLGTMGAALALNIAEKGFPIAVWNRTTAVTHQFKADAGGLADRVIPTESLADLVAAIAKPRAIILMVPAGQPVDDQIDALLEEIVDRFGKLPAQAQTLIDVHRLRVISQPYGVVKVDAAPGVISIHFRANPPVEPMRIIELIQKNKHIKLAGNDKLRIERELKEPKDRAQMVRDVLRSLGQPVKAVAAA